MPGENLTFSDNYFDLCLGSAILHHTDLNLAIKNIYRVLKPGGRAIFIEPLNQNLFLKCWRKLTPWRRSPAEKALINDDLKFIRELFPNAKFHFFTFSSILTEGVMIIFPNNRFVSSINRLLERFDNKLLNLFPSLGKYCAIVVLEINKD
jgi:ubiquinone/menaquinone biosynthesis C-methylase UbiE